MARAGTTRAIAKSGNHLPRGISGRAGNRRICTAHPGVAANRIAVGVLRGKHTMNGLVLSTVCEPLSGTLPSKVSGLIEAPLRR